MAHTPDSRGYFIGKVWRRRVTRRILPENTILHSKDRRTRCIASLDCRQLWYTDEWKGNAGRQAKRRRKSARGKYSTRLSNSILSFSFLPTNTNDFYPRSLQRVSFLKSKVRSIPSRGYFSIYLYEAENLSSPVGREDPRLILVIFPPGPPHGSRFSSQRGSMALSFLIGPRINPLQVSRPSPVLPGRDDLFEKRWLAASPTVKEGDKQDGGKVRRKGRGGLRGLN